MKIAVIILNYKTPQLVLKCLESIRNSSSRNETDIWVVDNASDDNIKSLLNAQHEKINFIQSEKNLGFSGGSNLALAKAKADYYLLLNSDTIVQKNSIDNLIEMSQKYNFAICAPHLLNQNGSLQPNAGDLPFGLSLYVWLFGLDDMPFFSRFLPSFHRKNKEYYSFSHTVGWVSGSAICFRKEVLEKVGLWDDHIFMYGEDVDYAIRAKRLGFNIGFVKGATITHIGGASSKDAHFKQWLGEFKGILYLYKKYKGNLRAQIVKLAIYKAIILRIIAFSVLQKKDNVKTYVNILKSL